MGSLVFDRTNSEIAADFGWSSGALPNRTCKQSFNSNLGSFPTFVNSSCVPRGGTTGPPLPLSAATWHGVRGIGRIKIMTNLTPSFIRDLSWILDQ